ncbi:MAG: dihydrolipoamide acetyltransferase family protein [Micropruina sp.]|uniref:dihydrolipoamide acetyltransferase family protein n=1 Tax=Micropruina sp. TaxID=2737536 RepID=UPI0039E2D9F1
MPRVPLLMPKMSMTMEFGTVEEWLTEVGGPVADGDAVVVVTTDKVDMDVESTCDGTLVEILAQPGELVPVGQPIAWIETEKDDLLGDLFAARGQEAVPRREAAPRHPVLATGSQGGERDAAEIPAPAGVTGTEATGEGRAPRAVPLARKLAAQAGIDLAAVQPSGPHRTIRARDVRAVIEARTSARPAEPAPVDTPTAGPVTTSTGELLGDAKSRRIRVATARVLESTALIPQFTVWRALDLSRLAVARKASLAGVSWNTILLRGYALMLREYPALNGSWAGDGVRTNPQIGVALAIDTPSGLLAPVLRDPHTMGVRALDAAIKDLAAAVKAGKVDLNAMGGGTGTVSNLGSFGIQRFNALLTPPQATALSLGAVEVRPVFDADGSIRPRTVCEAGLTVDHRVADGADAARAFATLQAILDDPFLLLG